MAVYNDVEDGKICNFGELEVYIAFCNFDVNINVPADHVMEATGELLNRSEVFTAEQVKRYELALKRMINQLLL
jgi:hypothetical protein